MSALPTLPYGSMKTTCLSLTSTAGICVILLLTISACGTRADAQMSQESSVSAVLDSLHAMASEANFEKYFGLYTGDAIFLGTDATERWTITEFKEYARPHFDRGSGWTYTPIERHVYLNDDESVAWFDEELENAGLGLTRGSGVLVMQDGAWKIEQYNLTIPIPNELANDVVEQIRALEN